MTDENTSPVAERVALPLAGQVKPVQFAGVLVRDAVEALRQLGYTVTEPTAEDRPMESSA